MRAETERERRQDRLVDSAAELFIALVTLEADAAAFLLRFVNRALMLLTRPIVLASTHRSASAGWPAISSIETDTRSSESASRQSARTQRVGWGLTPTRLDSCSDSTFYAVVSSSVARSRTSTSRIVTSNVASGRLIGRLQRDGRYVNIPRLLR